MGFLFSLDKLSKQIFFFGQFGVGFFNASLVLCPVEWPFTLTFNSKKKQSIMNDRSRKINNMFHRLTLHFNENRNSWENINYLSNTVNSFLEQSDQHNNLLIQSQALKSKFADVRNEERDEFNAKITQLAGALYQLSIEVEDHDLKKAINISNRSLWSNQLSISLKIAENIMKVAQLHETELQADTTTKMIYEQAKIVYQSFTNRVWLPIMKRNERTLYLHNIIKLEKSTLGLLRNQLDFRMRVLQNTSPDFFMAYIIIRKTPINKKYSKSDEVALTPLVQPIEPQTSQPNNPNDYAIAV